MLSTLSSVAGLTLVGSSGGSMRPRCHGYLGTLRFGAFVAVDITLVGFKVRSKR